MTEHKKKSTDKEHGQETPASEGNNVPPENKSENEAQAQTTMVALTMEEYDALQKQIDEAKTQGQEYLDCWQRERADFLNYKKRIERENESVYASAVVDVIQKYLVLQDDLERALKSRPTDISDSTWVDGIELIYRKLLSVLEKEGIQQIQPDGELFDPNIHEAVAMEENSDHESGHIIEVITPGYRMGDRVIRPARVRVAR